MLYVSPPSLVHFQLRLNNLQCCAVFNLFTNNCVYLWIWLSARAVPSDLLKTHPMLWGCLGFSLFLITLSINGVTSNKLLRSHMFWCVTAGRTGVINNTRFCRHRGLWYNFSMATQDNNGSSDAFRWIDATSCPCASWLPGKVLQH